MIVITSVGLPGPKPTAFAPAAAANHHAAFSNSQAVSFAGLRQLRWQRNARAMELLQLSIARHSFEKVAMAGLADCD